LYLKANKASYQLQYIEV